MGIQPEVINANRMSTPLFVKTFHKSPYDVQTKSLSYTGTVQKLAILAYNFEPPVAMKEEEWVGEGPAGFMPETLDASVLWFDLLYFRIVPSVQNQHIIIIELIPYDYVLLNKMH